MRLNRKREKPPPDRKSEKYRAALPELLCRAERIPGHDDQSPDDPWREGHGQGCWWDRGSGGNGVRCAAWDYSITLRDKHKSNRRASTSACRSSLREKV